MSLSLVGTYTGQYSVYINVCEYKRNFTPSASRSGELGMGKEVFQKFGWSHHSYFQFLSQVIPNSSLKQNARWPILDLEDDYTAA